MKKTISFTNLTITFLLFSLVLLFSSVFAQAKDPSEDPIRVEEWDFHQFYEPIPLSTLEEIIESGVMIDDNGEEIDRKIQLSNVTISNIYDIDSSYNSYSRIRFSADIHSSRLHEDINGARVSFVCRMNTFYQEVGHDMSEMRVLMLYKCNVKNIVHGGITYIFELEDLALLRVDILDYLVEKVYFIKVIL